MVQAITVNMFANLAAARQRKMRAEQDGAYVYEVPSGWKHIKSSNFVFEDRISAETDYRFCCEWEAA